MDANKPSIFLQFYKSSFSNVKFYGISAQGLEYDDAKIDEYQLLTERKQRAYIYTDKKSYDITEPFNFLISQSL